VGESNETPENPGAPRPAVSRSFIVGFRILLLVATAGAVAAAVAIGVRGRAGGDSGARYACPMHPEVTAAAPGQCPICRMALEPVSRDPAAGATGRREMAAMADLTAVENVRKHKIFDFVRRRSLLFNVRELRGPAWVDGDRVITALLYNDQIDALAADEPASLSLTENPKTVFAVRRTADAVVAWDRSTSRVRFRLDTGPAGRPGATPATTTPSPALQPGRVGWLEIARRPRDVLTVPAAAIVQSPEGPYVLAPMADGSFEKRPIEIGETFLKQGFAVVLSGLQAHDRVVARATFFLDADRRLGSHTAMQP
jgi:hypothetical protein